MIGILAPTLDPPVSFLTGCRGFPPDARIPSHRMPEADPRACTLARVLAQAREAKLRRSATETVLERALDGRIECVESL